LFALFA
jgi:hypothetical protein